MTAAFILWIVITGSGPRPFWEYDTRLECMKIQRTLETMMSADHIMFPHKSNRLRSAYCLQRDYTLENRRWIYE